MAASENDKMDAFILDVVNKVGPIKAGPLVERARAAGLIDPPKGKFDCEYSRPVDRSLQRLRKAFEIQFLGHALGWATADRAKASKRRKAAK